MMNKNLGTGNSKKGDNPKKSTRKKRGKNSTDKSE
jgi:hypothetical protein